MLCTAAVGLTRGRGVTDGCWLAKIIFFFPPHPFVFCMCPVILLQPFSVSLYPPPSLSPLALTAGVTKLCLTPGPELSLWWLFAQSWTRCTNRWMSRTGVRGQRECAMCGKYSKPVWNYSHTWNCIECLTDLWQFFLCVCVCTCVWMAGYRLPRASWQGSVHPFTWSPQPAWPVKLQPAIPSCLSTLPAGGHPYRPLNEVWLRFNVRGAFVGHGKLRRKLFWIICAPTRKQPNRCDTQMQWIYFWNIYVT